MTHNTRRKTDTERKGVPMAKGRDDQKEDDDEKTGFHTIMFHPYSKGIEELSGTSEDVEEGLSQSKGTKRRNSKVRKVSRLYGNTGRSKSRPREGMEICYTPMEKMVQALVHTTRSLRANFRKHKVKLITDGPMEEILKLFRKEGRLAKWATEIRTYDISYILRREAEGSVVKKFFGQVKQVEETPDANKGGTLNLYRKLQAKSTPTPRA
ncbi:hypothetical protein Tco_1377136 [Tanacetum coccineum]